MAVGGSAITKGAIDRLATALRQALSSDDPAFRKAYLRLFVGQIVVSDAEVRMKGPIGALAAATMNGGLPPADRRGSQFYSEWRPVGDSNPCYRRERAVNPIQAHPHVYGIIMKLLETGCWKTLADRGGFSP